MYRSLGPGCGIVEAILERQKATILPYTFSKSWLARDSVFCWLQPGFSLGGLPKVGFSRHHLGKRTNHDQRGDPQRFLVKETSSFQRAVILFPASDFGPHLCNRCHRAARRLLDFAENRRRHRRGQPRALPPAGRRGGAAAGGKALARPGARQPASIARLALSTPLAIKR